MRHSTRPEKRRPHKNDLAEANKEIERLNQQIERLKASKSMYQLVITKRTSNDEELSFCQKHYTIKSDAQTDLIFEFFNLTGKRLDRAPDFIRHVSDDGSVIANFEIIKVKPI